MEKEIFIIGGGIAGCGTALELANAGYSVVLAETLDRLLSGTSDRIPCRLGLGFHYIDHETALKNLYAALIFVKQYPGFRLAEDRQNNNFLKHCQYIVVHDSQFSSDQVLRAFTCLKNTYRQLCEEDASNQVFGEPDQFFRILTPEEWPTTVARDKIALVIETAENTLDWPKLKTYITDQVLNHPNITTLLDTTVKDIKYAEESHFSKFSIKYNQSGKRKMMNADILVNCAWHNIEKLNSCLGIPSTLTHRTQRLKAMAKIELPPELFETNSAVFCFGPHAAFTNLGNGIAFITYEPKTNVESSTGVVISEHAQKLLLNKSETQAEAKAIGEAILVGATEYIPALAQAKLLEVKFGIVRSIGDVDIYSSRSEFHQRRESGVEEVAPGYITNASMKLTYFISNAKEVLKIVRKVNSNREVLSQLMQQFKVSDKLFEATS